MVTRQKSSEPPLPGEDQKVGGSDPWFLIDLFITFLASKTFSPPARQLMHCSLFFSKIVYGGFGKKPSEVDIESYEHYAFGNSNDLRISRMLKVNVSRYKSQLFIIHHLINCFQTGLQWKNAFLRDRLLTGKCSSIHFFSLIFKIMFFIFMSQERCG